MAAGGGADGLGQAQRLAGQLLAVQIRVILIAAGGLFVAELKCALQRCQCIETDVGDHRFRRHGAGSNNASFEFFHISSLPW